MIVTSNLIQTPKVVTIDQNRWSRSVKFTGHDLLEWAVTVDQNTHHVVPEIDFCGFYWNFNLFSLQTKFSHELTNVQITLETIFMQFYERRKNFYSLNSQGALGGETGNWPGKPLVEIQVLV